MDGCYKKIRILHNTLNPQVSSTTKPNCTPLLGMLTKTYSPYAVLRLRCFLLCYTNINVHFGFSQQTYLRI